MGERCSFRRFVHHDDVDHREYRVAWEQEVRMGWRIWRQRRAKEGERGAKDGGAGEEDQTEEKAEARRRDL